MTKRLFVICLVSLLLILNGCELSFTLPQDTSRHDATSVTTPDGLFVGDMLFYVPDAEYVYVGEGSEYASYTVYPEFIRENVVQIRIITTAAQSVHVISLESGKATRVYQEEDMFYREDLTGKDHTGTEVLLKEPFVSATSWNLPGDRIRSVTDTGVGITTPSGSYLTIEVTTTYTEDEDTASIDYYAPVTGLVRSEFYAGQSAVISELSEINYDKPLVQQIVFYYPNIDGMGLDSIVKNVTFPTNSDTGSVLEKAFKELADDVPITVLTPGVRLLSLNLEDTGVISVDFSGELVSEMTAGSGFEWLILQSIVDTLGKYAQVDEVLLTVEGGPYISAHIALDPGETINVTG